jgi:hypothetical protein
MHYQLVLRLPGDAFDDFDEIVALENTLIARLGDLAMLENHDVGSDECRIVLITTDPARSFGESKAVLERERLLDAVVAVYRPIGAKEYTLLWPTESDVDSTES